MIVDRIIKCGNCECDISEVRLRIENNLVGVSNPKLFCPECNALLDLGKESPSLYIDTELYQVGPLPVSGQTILMRQISDVELQEKANKKVAIAKIEDGIVIDHVPAGKAFVISKILGLSKLAEESGDIIVFGVNFDSPTMEKKDVIKVENLSLTRDMLRVVSLIAPKATVTRIQGGQVIEKYRAEIPTVVNDVVICPDRSCITRHEEVPGRFQVLKTEPLTLKCHYCETEFYGALIRYKEGLYPTRSYDGLE